MKKVNEILSRKFKVLLLMLTAFSLSSVGLASESNGLDLTVLDAYVREPDANYKYSIISTVDGDGYKTYIVDMTSQQWLTPAELRLH